MFAKLKNRVRALVAAHPWVTQVVIWTAFLSGTVWRWFYVVRMHDPRNYVYSDMNRYVELAKQMADPNYRLSIWDVSHPLGMSTLLSWFYARQPSMQAMTYFQFAICALAPLVIGGLGWVTFGKQVGNVALVAASLYFPFVDYGGYFLSEIYLIFTLPLALTLFFVATRQTKRTPALSFALLAGFVFSISMALKALVLPALACFVFVYFFFSVGPPRKQRAWLVLALALGSMPLNAWQLRKCTTANEGHVCFGSNKAAADFLLGHYGRFYLLTWRDPVTGATRMYGSPSAAQHAYSELPQMNFAMTDSARNIETAMAWIREHPRQALVLTGEHVYDLFLGAVSWPSVETKYWISNAAAHYLFVLLILFPSSVRCVDLLRRRGLKGFLASTEALVLAPVVGLVISAAIATGEPRYRIPFDSLFMLAAIEFFRNLRSA